MPEREVLRVKIISMGDAECGKSCLIKRYCEKRFVTKYMATLGIDFGVTRLKTTKYDVKVNIFDLAGQPFFLEVRNEFYKDTQGAMLVYDVTNRSSFESLNGWLKEMRAHLDKSLEMESVVFVVCANKTDLGRRKVDEAEGRLWAERKGFPYFETSAQSGTNVQEMFELLIQQVAEVSVGGEKPGKMVLDLAYTPEQAALVSKIRSCEDNYKMLGLNKCSSKEEINKSYKHMAVLLHPDKNLAPGSDEAFKCIAKAREELLKNR